MVHVKVLAVSGSLFWTEFCKANQISLVNRTTNEIYDLDLSNNQMSAWLCQFNSFRRNLYARVPYSKQYIMERTFWSTSLTEIQISPFWLSIQIGCWQSWRRCSIEVKHKFRLNEDISCAYHLHGRHNSTLRYHGDLVNKSCLALVQNCIISVVRFFNKVFCKANHQNMTL